MSKLSNSPCPLIYGKDLFIRQNFQVLKHFESG
uniref:Uncharacterized protein n=1 Tax=Rhizophora mucronata TaxID=61149 RepID=A0A2P2IZN5_RHIMU